MGCDIHIYTEIKKNNTWDVVKVKNSWKTYLQDQLKEAKQDNNEKQIERYIERINDEEDLVVEGIYDGRNYNLFGILADVRNGRGFAGIRTGDGFIPISEPKGLPDDVSETVQEESDNWEGDGHSHSYFSLTELLDYDWTQNTKSTGWVGENEFKVFLDKGSPDSYSGGVDGGNVVHINNDEMKNIINNKENKDETKNYYTHIEWEISYLEAAVAFYTDTIPQLKEIADKNNISYDDIRIVFWFDN
jgi:hypothetical protein